MNRMMKIKPALLFFCLTLVAGAGLSSCVERQAKPPLIINMPYHEARNIIMQNGWSPVNIERLDTDEEYRLTHFYYEAGYEEVTACSGTGMGYCAFKFQNEEGQFLEVTTRGGDYNSDDASRPIVIYVGVAND